MLGVAAIVAIAAAVVVPVVAESVSSAMAAKEEAGASKAQTASDERVAMAEIKANEKESAAIAQAADELGQFEAGMGINQQGQGSGQVG